MNDEQGTFSTVGRTDVVRLAGEIDLANATTIGQRIVQRGLSATAVLVDLTSVSFLDSAGVRLLDELCAAGDVRVVAPGGSRALTVLRVCAFPPERIFESATEAAAT